MSAPCGLRPHLRCPSCADVASLALLMLPAAPAAAGELKRSLTLVLNRKRQAKITTELSEIVAGASSV